MTNHSTMSMKIIHSDGWVPCENWNPLPVIICIVLFHTFVSRVDTVAQLVGNHIFCVACRLGREKEDNNTQELHGWCLSWFASPDIQFENSQTAKIKENLSNPLFCVVLEGFIFVCVVFLLLLLFWVVQVNLSNPLFLFIFMDASLLF